MRFNKKKLGSAAKIRVGRVTGITGVFFGLVIMLAFVSVTGTLPLMFINAYISVFMSTSLVFPNETSPTTLHAAMFMPTIESQGTEEQKQKWLKGAENNEIIGTYAQTELGHG